MNDDLFPVDAYVESDKLCSKPITSGVNYGKSRDRVNSPINQGFRS